MSSVILRPDVRSARTPSSEPWKRRHNIIETDGANGRHEPIVVERVRFGQRPTNLVHPKLVAQPVVNVCRGGADRGTACNDRIDVRIDIIGQPGRRVDAPS